MEVVLFDVWVSLQRIVMPKVVQHHHLMDALEFLIEFWGRHSHAPSLRELSTHLGMSVPTAGRYLDRLEDQGYIVRIPKRHRSVRPVLNTDGQPLSLDLAPTKERVGTCCRVPLLGHIADGIPVEAHENCEEILNIPQTLLPGVAANDELFALRVPGDSMMSDNIREGDTVIVRKCDEVAPGDIAVVLVDGAVTIKRVEREGCIIVLVPSNPSHARQRIDARHTEVRILGVVAWTMSAMVHRPLAPEQHAGLS